jgi:hypothetical protein
MERRKVNMELKANKDISYGLVNQFRVLAERVATPDLCFHKVRDGYEMHFRNPWYTSIPVSVVNDIELMVNGKVYDKSTILFGVRDQNVPVAYARNLHEVMWGMGERASIVVIDPSFERNLERRNTVHLKFEIRTAFAGYHLPDNKIQYVMNREMGVK